MKNEFSRRCLSFVCISALTICWRTAPAQINLSENPYRKGMVVCAYPDASKAGIEILKKGGNAIDAAIAVQFALAVTHPTAGNIGGGGFMVFRNAKGEAFTLDYREKAPGSAFEKMYLDSLGKVRQGLSLSTHMASGVPGSVDGMVESHKKFGRLKWATLVQPAIDLANKGFILTEKLASSLNRSREEFIRLNPGKTYFVKDTPWLAGDVFIQTDLGRTLERIRDKGRAGFYEGETADLLTREMKSGNGIITKQDLKDYHSVWRKPIIGDYKEFRIISMPPPSSGGIALLQLLQAIESYPLRKWGFHQDSTLQVMIEAERRVYADRSKYLGDPSFFKVPADSLLQRSYVKNRMKDISLTAATPSSSVLPGSFQGYESDQTTHLSIVDRDGNAVSITTTLNGSFGSKIVVKGAGFLLNNEMDDFSSKPGVPNMYGLVGGKANSIQPGKRMLSSMTPTIIEKNGRLFMVVGTPGGSTIITSVFQAIVNVVEFGLSMQEAVSAKRFHHQWLPDQVDVEQDALSPEVIQRLTLKGYKFIPRGGIGRIDGILVDQEGAYLGGADPRGDDSAQGW